MRPQASDVTAKRTFDSQATWVIDVLGFFDMLSMGVCTTRHRQTSGRLVQDSIVCIDNYLTIATYTVCYQHGICMVILFLVSFVNLKDIFS